MRFVLMDSTGNMIESFTEKDMALEALDTIVENDPAAADEVALITYGADGIPVGPAEQLDGPSTPLSLPV